MEKSTALYCSARDTVTICDHVNWSIHNAVGIDWMYQLFLFNRIYFSVLSVCKFLSPFNKLELTWMVNRIQQQQQQLYQSLIGFFWFISIHWTVRMDWMTWFHFLDRFCVVGHLIFVWQKTKNKQKQQQQKRSRLKTVLSLSLHWLTFIGFKFGFTVALKSKSKFALSLNAVFFAVW